MSVQKIKITRRVKCLKVHFLIILFLAISSNLFAGVSPTSNFNYINDLVGDRAIGLGGAFTAISDDPSGAYYNPAGIAFAFDNQISLSVNTFKVKNLTFDKAIGKSKPYSQVLESLYPSFFGVIQSFGKVKVAAVFINTNNEILDQDDHYTDVSFQQGSRDLNTDVHINYNVTDNTFLGGLSAGMFLTDSVTIGVSGFALRRRTEQIFNQVIRIKSDPAGQFNPESYNIQNNYITDDAFGVYSRLGIQWMPNNTISTGLSLGGGTILSHSRSTQSQTIVAVATTGSNAGTTNFAGTGYATADNSISDSQLPVDVRAGIAYFPSKKFLISADAIFNVTKKNYDTSVNPTVNGALGIEYYLLDYLPVRAGFFTNFANTPKLSKGKKNQDMNVDLYGVSNSVSWQTKNSSVTIAWFYQFGSGEAQVTDTTDIQSVNVNMFQIGLTGSAKY